MQFEKKFAKLTLNQNWTSVVSVFLDSFCCRCCAVPSMWENTFLIYTKYKQHVKRKVQNGE